MNMKLKIIVLVVFCSAVSFYTGFYFKNVGSTVALNQDQKKIDVKSIKPTLESGVIGSSGVVKSVSDGKIIVSVSKDESKTFEVDSSTQIMRTTLGKFSDVKVGDAVSVASFSGPDGKVSATSIKILTASQ